MVEVDHDILDGSVGRGGEEGDKMGYNSSGREV